MTTREHHDPPGAARNTVTSVLVANRGEIARRVFRTCHELGLSTVAVFSDADAGSPHVTEADRAVRLPGAAPADTYLRADLLIDAARRAGADAVHPGYGFLSENAAFARAVIDAGLTWIGPPVAAIEQMGSKIESKRIMAAAGVPVLAELAPDEVTAADLPVLIKASAGGGGRGMRVVRALAELPAEIEAARAEAASAFGDPTVFCEPYLATGHHIEVQVMADAHGTVWAVGERECSIQRRHQKVVEEAPSPLVERIGAAMREALYDAARAAAEAVGYTGAGTVEFIADDEGRFYFLEMNTRLQVEHPVTECTTGLDLVELQLTVASGGRLAAEPPATTGHAIEVRLYAEDPAADWQPQSGTVSTFEVPGALSRFEVAARPAGLRLDSTIEAGSDVGVHYDPMLAKLIAWSPQRRQTAAVLARALRTTRLHGLTTNRDLLVRVLEHDAFIDGMTDTAFFDRHGLGVLAAPLADQQAIEISALAAALAIDSMYRACAPVQIGVPSGWRNVPSAPAVARFGELTVSYRRSRDGHTVDVGPAASGTRRETVGYEANVEVAGPELVVLDVDGVRHAFTVAIGDQHVYVDSPLGPVTLPRTPRFTDPSDAVAPGSLTAPMPGTVARIAVTVGQQVRAGEPLLWLEAMKMQHRIDAPADGTVTELPVATGQQIDVGVVLAVVTTAPGTTAKE